MTPLNSNATRQLIISKGIPMSKSKLYKLVSSNEIDFHKVANRLLFYKEEIEEWCKDKIVTPQLKRNAAFQHIIGSAQNAGNF